MIHGSDIYAQSHLNSAVFTSYSTQNELKLVSETTGIGDNYVGYAYVELGSTPFADKNSVRYLRVIHMIAAYIWVRPILSDMMQDFLQ